MSNSAKTKLLISFGMLMTLMTAPACSQISEPATRKAPVAFGQQTVHGSYIVQTSEGEEAIRRTFAKFDIAHIRQLTDNQFEIQLNVDPGLEELKRLVADSKGALTAIQPNYVYRTQ